MENYDLHVQFEVDYNCIEFSSLYNCITHDEALIALNPFKYCLHLLY